jgi:hypothetical protein
MENRQDVRSGAAIATLVVVVPFAMVLAGCASANPARPVHAGPGSTASMPIMLPYRSPATAKVSGPVSPRPSSTPSATAPRTHCHTAGTGFAISLPPGLVGAPTPIKAAQRFAAHGGVAGFMVPPNSVWRVVGADSHGDTVTAAAAGVTLHAVQLPDKSWAIDSGERCA